MVETPLTPPPPPPRSGESTKTFKMPKPKFGGLTEVSSNTWAAWTGGKPNATWTGLEDPNPKLIKPNQHRSPSISSQAKAQYYRVLGMEPEFSRDGDLLKKATNSQT